MADAPLVRDLSSQLKLRLIGEDRVRFLHGMVTNDIEGLSPGQGCRAALLSTKGKLLADLVVYADADALWIECDGALADKVKAHLDRHIVMDDVELVDVSADLSEEGVYGDGAAAAIAAAVAAGPDVAAALAGLAPYHHLRAGTASVARTPELGLPGYHVFGVRVAGAALDEAAWEIRRVEAGTPRYGVDMGEDRLPIEAGITDAISFTKGCYLGQEVIARATNLGHINKRLVGLVLDGEGAALAGARLSAATRPEAGVVTSSVVSPRLGPIALAYVHRTLWDPGTGLTVHDAAGERAARVVALPFPPAA